jgi:hypothetical protein
VPGYEVFNAKSCTLQVQLGFIGVLFLRSHEIGASFTRPQQVQLAFIGVLFRRSREIDAFFTRPTSNPKLGDGVFNAKSRTLQDVSGVRDFSFKTSRPLVNTVKVPLSWPSGGPVLGVRVFCKFWSRKKGGYVFSTSFSRDLCQRGQNGVQRRRGRGGGKPPPKGGLTLRPRVDGFPGS